MLINQLMTKIFKFYARAFFIISLISIPFLFISFSDLNKKEFTYKLWISSFFPQLIYTLYILKKHRLFSDFKYSFVIKYLDYKTIVVTFLMPFVIYLFLDFFKLIKISDNNNWDFTIVIYFVLLFLSALLEEALFRFIPYKLLGDDITIKKIILISSFFSIFHLFNPNFNVVGIINIIIVGVFFSFLYLKSNSILLVTIIHTLWNFSTGCILGSNISGIKIVSFLKYLPQDPDILSGGAFGFEGSIVTTIAFLIYSSILYINFDLKKHSPLKSFDLIKKDSK
jgi:membrane protease YdiL (CAAX protease family)